MAARFARATFLSNNVADLAGLAAPTLILQSTDDMIAPIAVGAYLHRTLPNSELRLIDNIGHCPHMSAPVRCVAEIMPFLAGLEIGAAVS